MSKIGTQACSEELITSRTRGEKVWFTAYIAFLLLCILFESGFLVLGILLKLFLDGSIDPNVFMVVQQQRLNWGNGMTIDINGATWIFFVVIAITSELILITGLCGSRINIRQRGVVNGSPDDESALSMLHVVSLRIFVASCFVLSIATFAIDAPLRQHMSADVVAALEEKRVLGTHRVIDTYQSVFICCGSTDPSDWIITDDRGIDSDMSPASCRKDSGTIIIPAASQVGDTTRADVRNHQRGCNTAIKTWLNLCAIVLFVTGTMLLILHIMWCIWRKKAKVPLLCFSRRQPEGAVHPLSAATFDNCSKASSESLVFLEQASQPLAVKDEKGDLPFQVTNGEMTKSVTNKPEMKRATPQSQETGTMTETTLLDKIGNLSQTKVVIFACNARKTNSCRPFQIKSAGNLSCESLPEIEETPSTSVAKDVDNRENLETKHLSATTALKTSQERPNAQNSDSLSVYSVESIEW